MANKLPKYEGIWTPEHTGVPSFHQVKAWADLKAASKSQGRSTPWSPDQHVVPSFHEVKAYADAKAAHAAESARANEEATRTQGLRDQHHGVDMTGPRGGSFHLSATGQKIYTSKK